MSEQSELRESVRASYATAATTTSGSPTSCCGDQRIDIDGHFGASRYTDAERADVPTAALKASLGCGNPTAVAELHEGERVLDLGSGGGIDVLLSARRVGPTGKALGLDMTGEMLALALQNAAEAGVGNVEFLRASLEDIPLPAGTIDVVISNCAINLSVDKPTAFTEMARVLVPGGRIGISDIVARDDLPPDQRAQRGSYAGCIAGALPVGEYRRGLRAAGFTDIAVTPTHQVADGMHSATIRAHVPG